ncbi:hypothetical protein PpBr36_01877 [Pyricularia pennisetigena]|uniref:hypothetical protein n=1 Tax=Pyricularia pennisetigena TaxID=1578925 RepID=UPI00115176BD|nr:hypothetical protein PpBr36_01877 [Pyricularia pennisetigena]TLS29745.1 hypothetical protein PpBr36_01877 [Pyricularia pennisetigena]
MSAPFIYDELEIGDSPDGENEQEDIMFDPNFVDDFSLPQRPQEQAVLGDDGSMNIDPDLDLPPVDNHFNELYQTIIESRRAQESHHAIDPSLDGYPGHIDNDVVTDVEITNNYSTATAGKEVAPTDATADEFYELNDLAPPQRHRTRPTALDFEGPLLPWIQIQVYNPDGQLTTNPTWHSPAGFRQRGNRVPFDPTLSRGLFDPPEEDFYLNGIASNSTAPAGPYSYSSSLSIQDQQPSQTAFSSSLVSSPSWLLRQYPHLASATMSSSPGSGQSSPSSASTESVSGPLAQDLDFIVGLYDDEQPLAPSLDPQATAENGTHVSSGPSSGQDSTQNQAAPDQPYALDQSPSHIEIPHQTDIFNLDIAPGPASHVEANCYLEQLTPVQKNDGSKPVLFIHGDHHTGQNWKYLPGHTETNLSFVDYFLQQGHTCYVPDMPMSGRSMAFAQRENFGPREPSMNAVEGELTSPRDNLFPLYDTARYHCQFPGVNQNAPIDLDIAGVRWDPYFLNYHTSRVPVWNTSEERITYGAEAVAMILERIGEPTVIITEGSGGVCGLIAADRFPDKIAGLILMGYPYAPFAKPFRLTRFDNGVGRLYHQDTMEECSVLTSGLASADLTFDPPLAPTQSLDVAKKYADEGEQGAYCFLQDAAKPVRKLVNVAKVPVLVVTPEAGRNWAYDWSVVAFLRQAGVDADWFKLAHFGLFGNGQLMWMEKNGTEVAKLLRAWIVAKTTTTATPDDDDAAATAAAAILAVLPDQVALADGREEAVRGIAAREAARYEVAWEERRAAWARREIAPPIRANIDQMECFYSWMPVLDVARADFQAAQAVAAATSADGAAGAVGDGAAAAP